MNKSERMESLTLISDREGLELNLHKSLFAMHQKSEDYAVLVMRLDDADVLNTTYGYAAGNEVVLSLVKRTARMLRTSDCFARVGAHEFVVILSETNVDCAIIIAQRLLDANRVNLVPFEDQVLSYKLSVGVGACSRQDKSAKDVLYRAQNSVLIAQRKGGSRVIAQQARDQAKVLFFKQFK